MANLVQWARGSTRTAPGGSPWSSITLDQLPYWFGQFGYQGLGYGPAMIQTIQQNREYIAADFMGFINGAFKTNGPVFTCILARAVFASEARFQFRRMNNGRPGKLFGTAALDILEHPWPNATTGDLLMRAMMDIDMAGNFYASRMPRLDRKGSKIVRLRPDWVTILKGTMEDSDLTQTWDPNAELLGYLYTPGGPGSPIKPWTFLPEEVAHIAPIPDPIATYRGMSWVQPILTEILGDRSMSTHKLMYFENGATPNLVVSMDTGKMDRETFAEWIELFENEHAGSMNAYKTLYLGQGAEAKTVGSNLKDLDYAAVQGITEVRIAAAARVPPIIAGFKYGLDSGTHENFHQAVRLFTDGTIRPLWRNICGSMETLVVPPPGSKLWYDDRDIAYLQEDEADEAKVLLTKSTAMRLLVDAGFDPDSIVSAIVNNDMSLLTHSGLYSVQLQPPNSTPTSPVDPQNPQKALPSGGNGNGNGNGNGGPQAASETFGLVSGDHQAYTQGVTNVEQLAKALLSARAGD